MFKVHKQWELDCCASFPDMMHPVNKAENLVGESLSGMNLSGGLISRSKQYLLSVNQNLKIDHITLFLNDAA